MARPEIIKTELGQRIRSLRGEVRREDFCARLGISKETFGNYERGDRVPDSSFLAMLRDKLGVDLNWLCTGEGLAPLTPDASRVAIAEAETRLDRMDALLTREPFPIPADRQLQLGDLRAELQAIATRRDLPDRPRARADLMLRLAFADQEAVRRSAARERQWGFEQQAAQLRVADAVAAAGWEATPEVRLALYQLSLLHGATVESLALLLVALRASGES